MSRGFADVVMLAAIAAIAAITILGAVYMSSVQYKRFEAVCSAAGGATVHNGRELVCIEGEP